MFIIRPENLAHRYTSSKVFLHCVLSATNPLLAFEDRAYFRSWDDGYPAAVCTDDVSGSNGHPGEDNRLTARYFVDTAGGGADRSTAREHREAHVTSLVNIAASAIGHHSC